MSTLETLAARCCSDDPGDLRQLDADIWCAVFAPPDSYVAQSRLNGVWCIYRGVYRRGEPRLWEAANSSVRPVTSSLDVAVSLIPDGHDWILEHVNGGLTIGARVGHNDPDKTSWGDTAALALCAAALRAREMANA